MLSPPWRRRRAAAMMLRAAVAATTARRRRRRRQCGQSLRLPLPRSRGRSLNRRSLPEADGSRLAASSILTSSSSSSHVLARCILASSSTSLIRDPLAPSSNRRLRPTASIAPSLISNSNSSSNGVPLQPPPDRPPLPGTPPTSTGAIPPPPTTSCRATIPRGGATAIRHIPTATIPIIISRRPTTPTPSHLLQPSVAQAPTPMQCTIRRIIPLQLLPRLQRPWRQDGIPTMHTTLQRSRVVLPMVPLAIMRTVPLQVIMPTKDPTRTTRALQPRLPTTVSRTPTATTIPNQ
mmetsp:Transcript_44648/g.95023  ORF Transcript_44648/g.95023 Transcript_44648/m.95023 type:complete len:292 (-) Transcript_44648:1540-2415(-)